jgi:hypothetical protein
MSRQRATQIQSSHRPLVGPKGWDLYPMPCLGSLCGVGPEIAVTAVASRAHALGVRFSASSPQGKVFRSRRGSHTGPDHRKKKAPLGVLSFIWRWARDSNPGNLSVQRFSRPPLSTTQPAHQNSHDARLEKRRIITGLSPRSSVGGLIFLD